MTAVEITVTGPPDDIERIAGDLLDARLVACAQIWPMRSRYWWAGRIEEANEVRVAMHSRAELFDSVRQRVSQSHPYEVCCIFSTVLNDLDWDYLQWIHESTAESSSSQSRP